VLESQAAAAAALRRIAHDEVGIDDEAGADAVTRPDRAKGRHAIRVDLIAARRIGIGGTP